MAVSLDDEGDEITGINITPLVDVMLVLLIIFMVTTSYIVTRGIELTLPQAETGHRETQASAPLVFALTLHGALTLNNEGLSWESIPAKIAAARASNPQNTTLSAEISADKELPHGQVIKLIDAIRKGGITNFSITVESPGQ